MSEVTEARGARRGMPVGITVILIVLVGAAGFAAGWFLRPDPAPQAEEVAHDLAALIEGPHPILDQRDNALAVAALYAEDAVGADAPSGDSAQGRDGIASGWQYMFAQDGYFTVDRVLADDRWAVLVTTWNSTGTDGEERTTPMVLLLEVRDGQIVSELDIYDAASAQV